jgi:hypothetical protein
MLTASKAQDRQVNVLRLFGEPSEGIGQYRGELNAQQRLAPGGTPQASVRTCLILVSSEVDLPCLWLGRTHRLIASPSDLVEAEPEKIVRRRCQRCRRVPPASSPTIASVAM